MYVYSLFCLHCPTPHPARKLNTPIYIQCTVFFLSFHMLFSDVHTYIRMYVHVLSHTYVFVHMCFHGHFYTNLVMFSNKMCDYAFETGLSLKQLLIVLRSL